MAGLVVFCFLQQQQQQRRVRKTLQATFLPAGYPTSVGGCGALGYCVLLYAAAAAVAV
jgi:hypothetical protein